MSEYLTFNMFTNLFECTKFLFCRVFFFRIPLRLENILPILIKLIYDKYNH